MAVEMGYGLWLGSLRGGVAVAGGITHITTAATTLTIAAIMFSINTSIAIIVTFASSNAVAPTRDSFTQVHHRLHSHVPHALFHPRSHARGRKLLWTTIFGRGLSKVSVAHSNRSGAAP